MRTRHAWIFFGFKVGLIAGACAGIWAAALCAYGVRYNDYYNGDPRIWLFFIGYGILLGVTFGSTMGLILGRVSSRIQKRGHGELRSSSG